MARKPVMPNGENCSEEQLLVAARASPSQRGFVRLSAIRGLILGIAPVDVARMSGVTLGTLYEWVERFNASGIEGMIDKPRLGRPRKVPEVIVPELRELVVNPGNVGV